MPLGRGWAGDKIQWYTPAMLPLRRLLRTTCALLIVLGLGTSVLEGVGCTNDENDAGIQMASLPAEGGADRDNSGIPGPNAPHCCPCIHSYPAALKAAIVPVPFLVGYSSTFALDLQAISDQHPQPLVPPPIV